MFKIASADGTAIACVREGRGPDLLLVHGTSTVRAVWAPIFHEHFTTCAMDRRGRGDSGDGPAYAVEREFEDVVVVAEALERPPIVFGHSFGGLCALGAALLSDRMAGLVLYEPAYSDGHAVYDPTRLDRLEEDLAAGDHEGALRFFQTDIVGMTAEEVELLAASPAWSARVATAPTIPRELRAHDGCRLPHERLAALDVPVLLLVGSDSPAEIVDGVRRLSQLMPAARVVSLSGQQHIAMYTAPDMLVDAVAGFARQVGIEPAAVSPRP